MNVAAAKKLVTHLKAVLKTEQSARFNMEYWGTKFEPDAMNGVLAVPVCKTQACLAGEALLALGIGKVVRGGGIRPVKRTKDSFWDIEDVAKEALDLTADEQQRLFHLQRFSDFERAGWPSEFEAAYDAARTPKARLAVAIRRVQHFIATNGAE